jgi:hypothetical protein
MRTRYEEAPVGRKKPMRNPSVVRTRRGGGPTSRTAPRVLWITLD